MLVDSFYNSYGPYTPDDFRTLGQNLHHNAKAIYVGTGGDLTVVGGDNSTTPTTFKNVPSGTLLQISATKIMATGTTAGNIVVLYKTAR